MHCNTLHILYISLILSSVTSFGQNQAATQRLFDIAAKEEAIYKQIAADPNFYSDADIERRVIELIEAYENYLENTSDDLEALILYGKLLRRAGDSETAFQVFLRADQLDPKLAVVKQQIGTYLAEKGKGKAALLYYQQAVEYEPESAVYNFGLGQLLYQFCDEFVNAEIYTRDAIDREMIKAFSKAVVLRPNSFDYYIRLGAAYNDQASPDWKAALSHWQKPNQSFKESYQIEIIQLHTARVLGKLGRHEEARKLAESVKHTALQKSKQEVLDELVQF
ncbi:MAG: tetratricopeptide repeat protein [Puniceicoccaceae bacterium]|nr:tetratricopeptide repeat protein [Puniceicoccaceae bacterium]